jgi:hypothetical protein
VRLEIWFLARSYSHHAIVDHQRKTARSRITSSCNVVAYGFEGCKNRLDELCFVNFNALEHGQ